MREPEIIGTRSRSAKRREFLFSIRSLKVSHTWNPSSKATVIAG